MLTAKAQVRSDIAESGSIGTILWAVVYNSLPFSLLNWDELRIGDIL
jgi:hypothetical protein